MSDIIWDSDWQDVVNQYRANCLELDCPEMSLTKGPPGSHATLRGTGTIRQQTDGRLVFRLLTSDSAGLVFNGLSYKLGAIINDNDFYWLSATDIAGRAWESKRIIPNLDVTSRYETNYNSISGELREICFRAPRAIEPRSIDETLELHIFQDISIPTTQRALVATRTERASQTSFDYNIAEFSAAHCRFRLAKSNKAIEVRASSKHLPPRLEIRLVESLQFLLAVPVWGALLRLQTSAGEYIRIRPVVPMPTTTHLCRPIWHSGFIDEKDDIWHLFGKYLTKVLAHTDENWHPLSRHLHSVCQASITSVDVHCLVLGVALEGIAKIVMSSVAQPSDQFKSAVANLKEHAAKWPGMPNWPEEEEFRKRYMSLLEMLNRTGTKAWLKLLARSGAIEQEDIKAWESLRHPAAHASLIDTQPDQKLLDLIGRVETLMYKLIFLAIDYQGRYTDYSAAPWQDKQYTFSLDTLHKTQVTPSSNSPQSCSKDAPADQTGLRFDTNPAASWQPRRRIVWTTNVGEAQDGTEGELAGTAPARKAKSWRVYAGTQTDGSESSLRARAENGR